MFTVREFKNHGSFPGSVFQILVSAHKLFFIINYLDFEVIAYPKSLINKANLILEKLAKNRPPNETANENLSVSVCERTVTRSTGPDLYLVFEKNEIMISIRTGDLSQKISLSSNDLGWIVKFLDNYWCI